jgi:hypothetical protein
MKWIKGVNHAAGVIFFMLLQYNLLAQPVVTTGTAPNSVTGVIAARWKGFNNPNNTNTAMYIGNSNIGSGGANRVERTGSIYIRPGNNTVSFQYDKTNDRLLGTINGNTIIYTGVSGRLVGAANICRMNYMNVNVRNSAVATVSFNNVTLNGNAIGPFNITGGQNLSWNIQNVDFSDGFTLNGTITLTSAAYGGNENSKVELTVGEMTPVKSTLSTAVCAGDNTDIQFTGLLPNKTYQVDYNLDGVPATSPAFTSSSTGTGSFPLGPLVAADFGKVLNLSSLSVSGGCTWTATLFNSTTLTENSSCSILPVTWLSFSGKTSGSIVELRWQTATEQRSSHFLVERSLDLSNWTTIGSVMAAGNSDLISGYSFKDSSVQNDMNYYRLKQVDIDKRYTYSKTIKVYGTIVEAISILPNPFVESIRIRFKNLRSVDVGLFSIDGRPVKWWRSVHAEQKLDAFTLPPGIYVCKIFYQDHCILIERIIKQ